MVSLRSAPTPQQLGAAWRQDAEAAVTQAAGRDGRLSRGEAVSLLRSNPEVGDNIISAFERAGVTGMKPSAALDLAAAEVVRQGEAVAGPGNVISMLEARSLPAETRGDFFRLRNAPAPQETGVSPEARVEASLKQRLGELKGRVRSSRSEIAKLKTEVAGLDQKIQGQRGKVTQLQQRKAQLQSQIASTRRRRSRNRLFAAFFGGASGLLMHEAVSNYQTDLNRINAELASAESEQRKLESTLSAYDTAQGKLRGELSGLESEEKVIESTLAGIRAGTQDPMEALGAEVASTEALSGNLKRQIGVLKDLKANAQDFSGVLSGLIRSLEAEVKALEKQKVKAEAALFASLIDVVIAAGGLPRSLDLGGMKVSTKAFIIDADRALKSAFVKRMKASLKGVPAPVRDRLVSDFKARLG